MDLILSQLKPTVILTINLNLLVGLLNTLWRPIREIDIRLQTF
jgi:hypothetical protein